MRGREGVARGSRTNSHLFQHDALGHGRTTEGVGLHRGYRVGLVVVLANTKTKTDSKERDTDGRYSRRERGRSERAGGGVRIYAAGNGFDIRSSSQ